MKESEMDTLKYLWHKQDRTEDEFQVMLDLRDKLVTLILG